MSDSRIRRALRTRGAAASRLALALIVGGGHGALHPAAGQQVAQDASVVVTTAGARYRAGSFQRMLLGDRHRDVWTRPVRVRVLSLDEMAGGLTALRAGGGMQTRSLRFLGADGREYTFRSVDKDPSAVLDPVFRGTVLADLVQDGISAGHPFAALVADPLLAAAGVLHAEPRLRVMPDDPRLGPFRAEFAAMLGIIEERPDENRGGETAFAGASKIVGSEGLTERLDEGPEDRVDARAYLRARLMDVFLGDWDRHRDQWRWATFDEEAPRRWLPIPRDRDQAFSDFDGLVTETAGLYVPQLVTFGPEYPSMVRLHWNGRDLDRWLLAELDRPAWNAVGEEVRQALTDEVIDDAVRRLPPEIHAVDGRELAATLKSRRDQLPAAWEELYRLLAREVDVRATDTGEVVQLRRSADGSVLITVASAGSRDRPWLRRRLLPGETEELRVHLRGGDDEVVVDGAAAAAIRLHIVGGAGDDRYVLRGPTEGVALYDHQGEDLVAGAPAHLLDRRPFDEWTWSPDDKDQPRDWGHRTVPTFWTSYGSDTGPFLGAGARHERYGFRNLPHASAVEVRGGFAPALAKARLELEGVVNRPGSPLFWTFAARVSGLDVLHYYGPGNASGSGDSRFHRVDLSRASASVGVGASPGTGLELVADVRIRHSGNDVGGDRFLGTLGPVYGTGGFTTLGLGGRLVFDPSKDRHYARRRLRVTVEGVLHPAALDATTTFGRAAGMFSALVASSPESELALAVRVGAERVFGRFPWHESAFIGGHGTVRGLGEQRFAGDGSAYGSGELRVRVARTSLLVPTTVGLFGFLDTGRVWVRGTSPGGWHSGLGGGVYLKPAGQPNMVKMGAATTRESTKLFVTVGLPY